MNNDVKAAQRETCSRFGVGFFGCDLSLKVGVSLGVKNGLRPLNGVRVRPGSGTCGWYIWAGEVFSEAHDFFVPLHGLHLSDWAPLVLPYLGLPPGSRFLITEGYEDVWNDPVLLKT
ncbi:immunity protein Imm33 domain-containing protein [Pseudomonas corrugata]|uniref:immunity protein Imm33 domain-containing protein n=1 Tax=Pseudomonas corrugata TaxID=47879 RepID=UPI003D9B160A